MVFKEKTVKVTQNVVEINFLLKFIIKYIFSPVVIFYWQLLLNVQEIVYTWSSLNVGIMPYVFFVPEAKPRETKHTLGIMPI